MGNSKLEKNYLKTKINILTITVITLLMGLFIVSLIALEKEKSVSGKGNKIRIETSNQKKEIKEMHLKKEYQMKDSFYNYAVIDIEGRVKGSFIDDFKQGDKINLETKIGYDNSFDNEENIRYSVPLVIDEIQEGTIIFELPRSLLEYENIYFKGLIVLIIITLIIIILIRKFVIVDIVKPIGELHKSSKSILKGNYNQKIKYDYHGEIGEFCHDFEEMRDELKVSKEREETLKKNEKELLACISHDLKTPLSSIIGYVEGIRDGVVRDEEGIKRYANTIIRRGNDLSKMIDDILEQTKTELNQMQIVKKEVYMDEYLYEVLGDLSIDVKNNDMELILEGEVPRALVLIDKIRMTQVITNIVGNSMKYARAGKKIVVCVEDDFNLIKINIRDFGKGIDSIDIPFVFNRFYRGEKSRNTNIPGSGLGLSIAKYILENHGGDIKCISKRNEGTTMTIILKKL